MKIVYRQLFDLLEAAERRQLYWLLLLIIAMALVDMVGVAIAFPFLAVAANRSIIHSNAILKVLHQAVGSPSDATFVLLIGVAALAFILLGVLVKVVAQLSITRFSHLRNHSLSSRLMRKYLRQPYAWFLDNNGLDLGSAILSDCDRVVVLGLVPAMRVLAQSVSLVFVIAMLFIVNRAVASIAIMGIGGGYAAIFLVVRHRLSRLGVQLQLANSARHRIALEAFGGVKEVKLLHLEGYFVDQYDRPSRQFANASASNQTIGELPRFFLEAIAFGGLVLTILTLLFFQSGDLVGVLPTLGVFGFAVLKIFPAIQQAYNGLTHLRFTAPLIAKIHEDLCGDRLSSNARPELQQFPAPLVLRERLVLRDVRFSYANSRRTTLDGLSLSIAARETVGIVGGTGAGKTTLVDLMLGLLVPESGDIVLDGLPLDAENRAAWQRSIGYVPQQIFLTDASIAANIAFGIPAEDRDAAAIERAAKLVDLHDFIVNELSDGYDTQVGERGIRLSGGQRQRIGIARALYHDPTVLIFDEATSALDTLTERAVMAAVNNLAHAKTIIMIAHRLTTVRDCDRIFLLENGRVAAEGSFVDLVDGNEVFRRMAS